jgi:glycosyltransferase involved in cell wall biosynthesis
MPDDLQKIERKETPSDRLVVGFVGRCLPMKGLHVLLDAVDRVSGAVPMEIRLVVATNDDEGAGYWKPLQERARRMPLVHWDEPGHLDAAMLRTLHQQIDVMVVPSLWPEYVGFVALEALALGTPVILSDYPTQRELLNENSGTLVPHGDAAALAEALSLYWRIKQTGNLPKPTSPALPASEYARQLLKIYQELGH